MRQHALYASLQCVVHPAELDAVELQSLEACLRDGGATLLEDADAAAGSAVTHIVCHPKAYQSFVAQRNERFVALVRPEWVFRTFLLQKLLPVDRFSPNPALIFSTLAISAGTMAKDPRKVINGLITHFGGQIVDQKEVYAGATHILYQEEGGKDAGIVPEQQEHYKLLQLSYTKADLGRNVVKWSQHFATPAADKTFALPSCVVAYLGQRAGLDTQHHVKFTWIEECVLRHCRVPEGPFAHKPTGPAPTKSEQKARNWKTQPDLHLEDLNLSKCAQVYKLGRTELGAELSVVRKLSNEKLEAMKKTMHGSIVLLAQHIAPLLREKLSDMLKTVDAKVANVPFGDSYQDIVGKVVTNASFVVCRYRGGFEYDEATRQGEKYKKALSWRFDNVLSHEWVFACLSKWEHVAEDAFRYTAIKDFSGDTDSTASDHSSKKKDSGDIKPDEEIVSKTKLAITPSVRSAKKAAKGGQGRFDVDGILTEIDKVPTPADKKIADNVDTTTPATNSKALKSTPGRTKDVACTLFDTPTNTAAPASKRKSRKTDTDEPMPQEEASADVEEVEKEPATKATETDAEVAKEPPIVISISSDSNANESGTVEEPNADPARQEAAKKTKAPAKKSKAKKRKGADSEESDVSKSSKPSSKKPKKEAPASKTSRAALPPKDKRIFLLTGDRDQAAVHTSIISSLGGTVSKFGRVFDSNCTHIICSELKRTEKFIAGCAAGKWILKPSYLDACATAGKFIDEAAHEWGSHKSDKKDIDERIWPEVSAYWRQERAGGNPGAFAGWKVFIHAKCVPPRDMCERIVLAGGGSVIPLTKSANFDSLAKESTPEVPVVALFPPEVPTRDLWLKKLKTHDIECIKANFLIDYITKKQAPPVKREDYRF
ncbi:Nucleotide excision repair factor NEF2, RAD4/CUT5 component [Phytophthora cinnamomi]|uniref:Nucleotide excision repair factor NEF2, RAD4/CUT5 component n=1 Tax=Phytophthora cinnamomi TaxID=4785 RepID=UPI003559491D|nr:Nucleotide excision repair factor NEF2, RAD4/CUT5 component [Phytophthora cinnamomi]